MKLTDLYVSQQQTFFALSLQKENFHFHAYPVLTNVGVKVVVKSQLNFYTFLMITIFMRSLLCKCGIILQTNVNKGFIGDLIRLQKWIRARCAIIGKDEHVTCCSFAMLICNFVSKGKILLFILQMSNPS